MELHRGGGRSRTSGSPGLQEFDLSHLAEDLEAASVSIDAATMAKLDRLISQHTVVGSRYNAQSNSEVDTENF